MGQMGGIVKYASCLFLCLMPIAYLLMPQLLAGNAQEISIPYILILPGLLFMQNVTFPFLAAGHLRYFLIFLIIKNDLLHFCQVNLTGSGLFK